MLFAWIERAGRGIGFGPDTGFNLPDGSCLSPDAAWLSLERWITLTPQQ
jgi:Uma2 family endonuclease